MKVLNVNKMLFKDVDKCVHLTLVSTVQNPPQLTTYQDGAPRKIGRPHSSTNQQNEGKDLLHFDDDVLLSSQGTGTK